MKLSTFAVLFLFGCAIVGGATLALVSPRQAPSALPAPTTPSTTAWPDYSANGMGFVAPSGTDGEQVAYGYRLVSQTFALIGPEAPDAAVRFAGNNLACQSCHLDGGTNRHALPLVGVYGTYPKFLARDNRVVSLPERLNECMTRSMNGRPMPDDSREMSAFLAYLKFIGGPQPVAAPPVQTPSQPADAARGSVVFAEVCAVCHQKDGLGARMGSANDAGGYRFPPLWGPDSFNDAAGMDRFANAVSFIRHNMPRGVDPQHPQLSLQQAWDVVAYMRSQPRPHGPVGR